MHAEARTSCLVDNLSQCRRGVTLVVEAGVDMLGNCLGAGGVTEDEICSRTQLIDRKHCYELGLDIAKLLIALYIIVKEGLLQLLDRRAVLAQNLAALALLLPKILKGKDIAY